MTSAWTKFVGQTVFKKERKRKKLTLGEKERAGKTKEKETQ